MDHLNESMLDLSESDEDASLEDIELMIKYADSVQQIPKMSHVQIIQ